MPSSSTQAANLKNNTPTIINNTKSSNYANIALTKQAIELFMKNDPLRFQEEDSDYHELLNQDGISRMSDDDNITISSDTEQ